jgi:hypothetical protein
MALFLLPNTGSMSGFIGVSIALLFFLILSILKLIDKKTNKFKTSTKVLVSFGLISLLIIIIVLSYSIPENPTIKKIKLRIMSLENKGMQVSFTGRRISYFWKMAAYMIRDYPLSGVGIGGYIVELPNYAELNSLDLRIADSAENYILQVGAELGVLGILLSLWIFWEILLQIKKTYKNHLSQNKWIYIVIGISAGIVSIFINFVFHTYIGSYEIKYTFWLLVGLMFCLGKIKHNPEKTLHPRKHLKVLSIAFIIVFCVVHIWNSTHSLSLKKRTEQLGLEQNFGLYDHEKTQDGTEFRWTKGYGGVTLTIEKPVITIPLLASHPDIEKSPVIVKVFLIKDFFKQKNLLGEITLRKSEWNVYEYDISDKVNQKAILLLKVSRTWNPMKERGIPDPRDLGVAIGKISYQERSQPPIRSP